MKKIMGHLTGKLSLSILSVIVLLVGVLAGMDGITSKQAGGKILPAASRSSQNGLASATQATPAVKASSHQAAAPVVTKASAAQTHSAPAVTAVSADKAPKPPITKEVVKQAMSKLPLTFEPNQGQIDSQVKYIARSLGYQVFMTGPASAVLKYRPSEMGTQQTDFVTMKLAGANTAAAGQLLEPTGGVTNYLLGNDPAKWHTNIPNYAKLRYDNIYPGIDVIYQGDHSRFRYDFQVNPGADPKSIQIAYDGAKGVSLDKNGNAVIELGTGRMVASNPNIYQESNGQKHTIGGHYVLSATNTLSFEVGAYDKSQALVIDPSDTYAIYVGPGKGNGGGTSTGTNFNTVITAVAMDSTGPYMAGFTGNLGWAGGTAGLVGFYSKANLDLTATASVTMIGSNNQTGSSFTAAYGIATYAASAYVVGVTNAGSNWPSAGPLETAPVNLPNDHAFLVVAPGATPKLSTLLYGSGLDIATSVAVEQAGGAHPGRIHITGATSSGATSPLGTSSFLANLPMVTGASQPVQAAQASSSGRYNAFYLAVDSSLKSVDYATLFGGYGRDVGNGVAVDPAGNGYVVGTSNSFGAGTVVGFKTSGNVASEPAPNQFTLVNPQGSGCPVNPAVIFPTPIPPSTFIGVARPAQGVAIVNDTAVLPAVNEQVVGITITDPGAGYDPVNQSTLPVTVLGCGSTSITALVQDVPGGTSANNLPIPSATLTVTSPGTFYSAANPPVVTITGGSCTVEPTASAVVSSTSPFGVAWLVLDTPGTGCTSMPTVTIQAPPTVGGVAGQTATATYTQGTIGIELDRSAIVPANDHAFVAKFNPNTPASTIPGATTNPYSLSYATVIGGTVEEAASATPTPGTCTVIGNVTDPSNIPPAGLESGGTNGVITPGNIPNATGATAECESGVSIAVDEFGNAYVGGSTLIPATYVTPPGTPTITPIFNETTAGTAVSNVTFTSPGVAGGELQSITLTSAGIGYPTSTTIGVFFDWSHDINGGCLEYPAATATTDAEGSIVSVAITSRGFGCTSVPGVGFEGGFTTAATAVAALGTQLAGNPNPGEPTGFVLEIVSNQSINGGLTTTNTQDGIPLGPHAPSSVAGWPAMVYATLVGGDEDCTVCSASAGTITGGFGNGADITSITGASASGVLGVAVDGLGQTYVSGFISNAVVPTADIPTGDAASAGDQWLLMRRRVNAKGYPSNAITSYTATHIETANGQFLSNFPVSPNTYPPAYYPNTGITPFGDVILGAGGLPVTGQEPNLGAFQGIAFDPGTLTACAAGFVDESLPSGDTGTGTGIFPNGTASQPAVIATTYAGTAAPANVAPTANGFVACAQFANDIVVGVQTGNPSNPVTTSYTFTMPAGTQSTLPNGATNPAFPASYQFVASLDGANITGGTVTLGPVTKTYYEGKSSNGPPDSGSAHDIDWLTATTAGTTITLALNPSTSHGAPGASFLDPGIYYCVVTVTPSGAGDNANIPQSFIVQLNVTGLLQINTTAGGGVQPLGTDATGANIDVSLTQGTAGTAAWNVATGGTLDASGNLVINVPVWSNVPLNSPSHSNFVFLVNQGTLTSPLPVTMGPGGVTAFPILGSGLNTANQNLANTTGFNIPIGATTGGVFLTPAEAAVEPPQGLLPTNDLNYLPPGGPDCSPNFVNPPDNNDPTSKGGANDTVCYIQVILPPTILQGAPTGTYTVGLQFMSVPNLTDPETPVRNDHSNPYLDAVPWTSPNIVSTANPYVENFCVGTGCPVGYSSVPSPSPAATLNINVTVTAGPLIINSPWQSNTITSCLTGPTAGPGPFFSVPVCNTNSPIIPLAPFTVPSGWVGQVTSNINSASEGNNPSNTYNNVVLDTRNLGLSSPSTYTASLVTGVPNALNGGISLGPTTVTPLQVANDLMVYQFFPVPTIYPVWDVPTCTLDSPPIPAGVLKFPASGVLPVSTPGFSTTAFTITIDTSAATMTNGFYAGVIKVTPANDNGMQSAEIPVCLEVGNNIIPEYETIPQPTTVPPPFDPTGNIVPPSGLVLQAGNTQYVQVITNTLGPNQAAPISGTQTFGTPSFVSVPVSITPSATNPSWVMPLVAPTYIGNEFSIVPLGTITEGINTATNCSLVTGAPNGPCFTDAYMDLVIAAPSGTTPISSYPVTFTFTDPQPASSLLSATDPPPPLNVIVTNGPQLVYTPAPSTNPINGVIAYITLIPALGYTGGFGYTSVPNVSFHGGCAVEPTAIATISQPGATGYVSAIYLTNPGSDCTSAPVITIDPPSTAGGVTAAAEAFISNGVLSYTFNQMSGTTPASATSCQTVSPGGSCVTGSTLTSFQAITVQASTGGISVLTPTVLPPTPTIYYNPPTSGIVGTIGAWLNVAAVNCQPILVNPTPLTECEFTLSTNSNVTLLPQGTYNAYVDFLAAGFPPNTQPAVVTALVTLNVSSLTSVISTLPGSGAAFQYPIGAATTNPASQSTQLSVTGLPSGVTGIPVSVSAVSNTGPTNWLQIALNGGAAGAGPETGTLTTTPIPLVITVNPAVLSSLTTATTYNGTITVSTPSSSTSNPTVTIPVTLTVQGTPSLQFSDTTDATATCSTAGGNESCTAAANFTIGQTASAPTMYTTVLTLLGSTADTLTISSNVPWLIPSVTSSTNASTPLTISINPTLITNPVAGPLVGVITAKGVNGPEKATFTVNLGVANPPTINLPTPTCTPANPVTAGTASVTCTTSAALSVAPANPTTLPATVTASISSGPCTVTPATSTITLSSTATPLSFTITPTSGTGISASCGLSVGVATTGGITPAITASTSASISVQQATLTASPTTQLINLPVGAAPSMFTETIQAISPGGNNVAVPFTCTPSVALPVGGGWLTCTNGTTTTAPPYATSTGTVTAASLAAGSYGGSVAFSSPQLGVNNPPINVPVTLEIGALSVTGGPVTFNHQFGVTVPVTQNLMISSGVAAINWTATVTPNAGTANCGWLIPGAVSGTTVANSSSTLTVGYSLSGLTPGNNTYACTIAYSPAASYGAPAADTVSVVVTLNTSTNPVFVVTPGAPQTITETYPAPSTSATFTVAMSSILAPATSVTATITPFGNNPLNGASSPTPLFTAPSTMTVTTTAQPLVISINPAGLPVGTYQGSFTLSSTSTPNTAVVTVNLVIEATCGFTVSPAGPINLTNVVPSNGSTPVSVPGAFSVLPSGSCAVGNTWTASSDSSWLLITGGGSGNGSGVGSGTYLALSNTTPFPRTAHITFTPSVGVLSVITVTQPASTAPILDLEVTALYQQILGRDPDAGGYAFWTGPGTPGGLNGLGVMADDFFTSPESYNTNFGVIAAYKAATGASPTYAEFTAAVQGLSLRYGTQTVGGLFSSLIAGNTGYSAASLYQNLLGRPNGAGDAACLANGLQACFLSIIAYPANATPVGPGTNNEFWSTGTFANHTASCTSGTCTVSMDHTNLLYIDMLYFTTLSRDPDAGGQQFWFGIANSGGAGILFQGSTELSIRLQIYGTTLGQGFIESPEFQSHF